MNELLLNRIARSPSLPDVPQVAVEMLGVGADRAHPAMANARLAEVVARDERLTHKILLAVNSPFYHVDGAVHAGACETVEQAIRAVGGRPVKVLAIGVSLMDGLLGAMKVPFDVNDYVRRALFAAAAARKCAQALEPNQVEACFLSSLLMDVGMLLLGDTLGADYAKVLNTAGDHARLEAVEREMLDLTHADVAGHVARYWKLPDVIQVSIARHHHPEHADNPALRPLTEIASLAGQFADVFTGEDAGGAMVDLRRALERRGVLGGAVDAMLAQVAEAAQALAPTLETTLEPAYSIEAVRARAARRPADVDHGGHDGCERRRAMRIGRDGSLHVRPYHQGVVAPAVRVRCRDVSASGLGIAYAHPMLPGAQFVVEVAALRGTRSIVYTVVRCIPLADGEFLIGSRLAAEQPPNGVIPTKAPAALAAR